MSDTMLRLTPREIEQLEEALDGPPMVISEIAQALAYKRQGEMFTVVFPDGNNAQRVSMRVDNASIVVLVNSPKGTAVVELTAGQAEDLVDALTEGIKELQEEG